MVPWFSSLSKPFLIGQLLFSICITSWGKHLGQHSVRTLVGSMLQLGPRMWLDYLGILKHAEVSVHVKCKVLVLTPLVQFGSFMELPLVGKHICQKQVIVGLSPLLPLLEKLEAQEIAPVAMAGSSLYKG